MSFDMNKDDNNNNKTCIRVKIMFVNITGEHLIHVANIIITLIATICHYLLPVIYLIFRH